MTIHEKINAKALIQDFARISQSELQTRVNKLGIKVTGDFESSIRIIGKAASEGLTVEIFYNYYGIFSQYGLGRGIQMGDQGVARMIGGGRKQKKWMTGIGHIRKRLGEIYARDMADGMQQNIADSIQKKVTLKL